MSIDADLQSVQQARTLCRQAKIAFEQMKSLSQQQIDKIVEAMADAGHKAATYLAKVAVNETGFGVVKDKAIKNQIATKSVYEHIRDMKTVGVINTSHDGNVIEIADPVGVIAGIIPVTNPTSTTLFKSIIAIKSRNTIVFSPHPAAVNCITESAELMQNVIVSFGVPKEAIGIITQPSMAATQELMQHPDVGIILATGGTGMVKSAYSSGKPAYGVGPGNVPAFIEKTADVKKAIADIIISKTFDNGTVCASEQSIVADSSIYDKVLQYLNEHKAYLLNEQETQKIADVLVTPKLTVNPQMVGQPAFKIAAAAGLIIPQDTTILVAELDGVGKGYPLSIEKLSPVISLYKVNGWEAGCDRCMDLLNFGGIGHTLSIHSKNRDIIMEFGLQKPAYRILVNTPSTHGAVGGTTELPPSLTLGCGTFGGNATSDNIGPQHLLNIKRLAFETKPLHPPTTTEKSAKVLGKKLVSEKDVKEAISNGTKIKLVNGIIVTPLARDLGEASGIFEY
jgi:acetaldehyde dehydrogenase (acetylating)